jgi:cytochrome d ubiquinol oxidase subunit I
MPGFFTPLMLSRALFALTTIFHMLWPLMSIGLALFMVIFEVLWFKTKDDIWYRHLRFWAKVFLLTFGIGVASGVPLEMEFGMNWARFSKTAGDFFGNILGFEAAMAFALEAAFLAIFMFGWRRVPKAVHLLSNVMVFFGASLSAFWIMGANSWMQVPTGVSIVGGRVNIVDYGKAVFNPLFGVSFSHMWLACLETTLFMVAGISARYVLKGRNAEFFLRSFKIALVVAVIVAPLQIVVGDISARKVVAYQPAKAAAMEANWSTNPPGTGAPFAVLALPDKEREENRWSLEVPNLLSFLSFHTLKGRVPGLRDFPPEDRPPVGLPFYAFRVMVLIGFVMLFMTLWALEKWLGGRLVSGVRPRSGLFWTAWYLGSPLGFLATELGWAVREVGRQPWIIYGLMRTSEGVSNLSAHAALVSLIAFGAVYTALFVLFLVFAGRILERGPDFASPVPPMRSGTTARAPRMPRGGHP